MVKLESKDNYVTWMILILFAFIVIFGTLTVDKYILNPVPSVSVDDVNITMEHSQLAGNQSVVLGELRLLNLYSQCVVDTNGIRSVDLPIDDQGGFRRVSIVQLVCPELQGSDKT